MRIGTVGSGFIVKNFIDAASHVDGVEIAAVYSRSRESADCLADQYGIPGRYTDREAFLSCGDLDFIYVASPNSLHYEWTRDALLAGRHVICEKPFVSRAAELSELIRIANEKDLFLFEASVIPHLPNYRLLREHIAEVGALRFVQANFSQYSSRYDAFLSGKIPNVFSPEFAGGALMDLNCYNLRFITGLLGAPEELRYFANIADNGIDTSGVLVLRYGELLATATACKDSGSRNFVQIQGTKGCIYVPGESSLCRSFTVRTKDGETGYNVQELDNVMVYELDAFAGIYRNRDFQRRDDFLAESMQVAELLEKARADAGIHFPADDAPVGAR